MKDECFLDYTTNLLGAGGTFFSYAVLVVLVALIVTPITQSS
jgi:hypothetical protein